MRDKPSLGLEREQRKSAIKIPARCVDKLENGNYQVFLKKQDRFYFVDSKNPENNKIMLGKTVAKNLQNQSGSVPLYSNNAKIKLKQLFNEFDFLISKGLDFDTSFETIGKELEQTYYQTESILENLDKKILEYVEENKAYARPNTRILKTIENLQKELLLSSSRPTKPNQKTCQHKPLTSLSVRVFRKIGVCLMFCTQ